MSSCLNCYLNGQFLPLSEARISPLDRGFLFGDGIYEFFPIYQRKLFRFEQHLARLRRSLQLVRIPNPHTAEQWLAIGRRLIESLPQENLAWYLQISRGTDSKRDHAFPHGIEPSVFAMISPLNAPSPALRSTGIEVVSAVDQRWQLCHIKATSMLGNVMARQFSAEVGAHETVMFRDGYLTEASSSNVWMVRHGRVVGPVLDNLKLEGVRWALMRELCQEVGVDFELRLIPQWEVLQAEELLLTSATKEVIAATKIDQVPIGGGQPGAVYEKLYAAYQRAKQRFVT